MENWPIKKLGDLLTESKTESTEPNTDKRLRVKLNVGGVEKRPDTTDKEGATKYFVRKAGQFIYGKQNLHKGAFGIVPAELNGFESSSDIPAFDINESCSPEWIYYFFKQGDFYLKLESLAKGVGSKRIQPSQLYNLEIPLPSLKEQHEILNSIHDFEYNYSRILKELSSQLDLVKKLRKSIIQEGVEGGLTNNWRSDNTNQLGTDKLLKNIRLEKAQLIAEKKIPKEKASTSISKDEIPYEIPINWTWIRFVDVIQFMAYGTSQKTNDNHDLVPVFRMGNISNEGTLIYENFKFIPQNHRDLPKLYLRPGDIVFNRTNSYDLVGKSAVYSGENNTYTLASYLIKITLFKKYANSDYINFYLLSPICRKTQIEPQIITQTNQANFSGSKLKNILVPFPPLEEQNIIVEKIKNVHSYCDGLEQKIKQNQSDVIQLVSSTLKNAFKVNNNQIERIKSDSIAYELAQSSTLRINYIRDINIMELTEILKAHGKMSAADLWKMSKFESNIEAFYAELKIQIEKNKTIRETEEKGFLELTYEN
ncbi:MAG: restriction endonuclease subunit S [Mucilaginibacter sp.]|uniref:restriction endonuclease subunit S n=1 Tax=Mucilaginibacter sp. TaxID=1882438 RepID=UPI003266A973